MFGEIKKMLGIEDVKIDLQIPEKSKKDLGVINGKVLITSFRDSRVEHIEIKLIEKYHRGRKDSKLVDEYTLGDILLETGIDVRKQDLIEIPFELPFTVYKSDMDKMEDNNMVLGGFIKLAKKLKGVKSEYRIEATAHVSGTKLAPLCIKSITLL
ncbi:MAG: sporulation protein [Saprospiraceae bacterium]|nr:sporulation protein [Saprospiraceae bacterium]